MLRINKVLPRPKDKVIVRIRLDGSLRILWKGKVLLIKEIGRDRKDHQTPTVA
jgi:hypothetical protein